MDIAPPLDPVEAVQAEFGEAVLSIKEFRGETTIIVQTDTIPDVLAFLRNTPGLVYNFLSDISAVDYYPDQPSEERPERFGVSYHLYSMIYNRRLRVKVFAMEEDPAVPTVLHIWQAANWLEREIADLMGIRFDGHPDKRRLLMPEDWKGHPHRRDYPLGKEVIQFSFNAEEIMKHKPFAKE